MKNGMLRFSWLVRTMGKVAMRAPLKLGQQILGTNRHVRPKVPSALSRFSVWRGSTRLSLSALVLLLLGAFASAQVANAQVTETFTAPGTAAWTVPDGVTSITVKVWGGGGGGGGRGDGRSGGDGGGAGHAARTFDVTPGQVLDIVVGSGGGGGLDWYTVSTGGGGGGLSAVFDSGTPLIVAPGGGGGGGGDNQEGTTPIGGAGGPGGGINGSAGSGGGGTVAGGGGGTQTSGGTGGTAGGASGSSLSGGAGGSANDFGTPGAGGSPGGGDGGRAWNNQGRAGGGGGGAGLYGGGGGGAANASSTSGAGGGGGSGFAPSGLLSAGSGRVAGADTDPDYDGNAGRGGLGGGAVGNNNSTGTAGASGRVVVRYDVSLPTCDQPEGNVSEISVGGNLYRVHRYTQTGCGATFTPPSGVTSIEGVLVGGGGGGGGINAEGGWPEAAGGGGAGGYLSSSNLTVTPLTSYQVIVGSGGAGGVAGTPGAVGGYSTFGTQTALGGGGGGSPNDVGAGGPGGSGGGGALEDQAGGAGTSGQGNDGGAGAYGGGGGGGGAGGMGAPGSVWTSPNNGGLGGNGVLNSISGVPVIYAAGGNGGNDEGNFSNVRTNGANAAANTGNGGGGASSADGGPAVNGGTGGSGVVVVRYAVPEDDDDDDGGVTPPPDGGVPNPGEVGEGSIDISQLPMFLSSLIDPNVLFVLDDSGSMLFETLPDETRSVFGGGFRNRGVLYVYPQSQTASGAEGVTYDDCIYRSTNTGGCDYWRDDFYKGERLHLVPRFSTGNRWAAYFRSSAMNRNYYDPNVTYQPWVNSDGSEWPDANPTCTLHNPALPGKGCRNLTVQNTQRACWIFDAATSASSDSDLCITRNESFWPATYFVYNGGGEFNSANYTRVEIAAGTDQMQNFANWYTYHRSRILASQAGVGRAFQAQADAMRVGFGAINEADNDVDGVDTDTLIRGVRKFDGAARQEFFDLLYGHEVPLASTPLRRALDDAGQYFTRSDNRGPWGAQPGINDSTPHVECRLSYTILMTDGYWNRDAANVATGNIDGAEGPTITGPEGQSHTYTPRSPFEDSHSNTLADVAMYYWKNDLRANGADALANRVPTSPINPAFWQHMVTFGVSLGPFGSIDPDGAFAAILDESVEDIDWPQPSDNGTFQNIDDLLHAGVNSRGGFFSAADPDEFARELGGTLTTITDRTRASSTALVANSVRLDAGTRVYQARFDSSNWSGEFKALVPEVVGNRLTLTEIEWEAEAQMPSFNARKILTHEGGAGNGQGIEFLWGEFNETQQQQWFDDDPDLLNFVRGDRGQEIGGSPPSGKFRARGAVLGDMVNSDPVIVHRESFGYQRIGGDGASSYEAFVQGKRNRDPVIYVGANDGMLHAFNADDGEELFAFIPHALLPHLKDLADLEYDHRYYVDGDIHVSDAYWNGAWKTVLLGTTGAGGRVVFALDVTDPSDVDGSNVLWEFTDPDLGYTIGTPMIARLNDGTWAAIFGNGYNSSNDRAMLFVVDLETGDLIGKVDTGVGDANSPNGLGGPVGLARTEGGEEFLAVIYAGDLHGNLWKFDLSSKTVVDGEDRWGSVDFTGSPLFAASGPGGQAQPITVTPELARHDLGGYLVFFGTGRYFATSDPEDLSAQSIYGIWDRDQTVGGRDTLQQQEILAEQTVGDFLARGLSQASVDWSIKSGWYLDLVSPGGILRGERVVQSPEIWFDRLRVVTTIPNVEDPCSPGATSWIAELDLKTGGRLDYDVFDLDGSGTFDEADRIMVEGVLVPTTGISVPNVGVMPPIVGEFMPIHSDSLGNTSGIGRLSGIDRIGGRQVWRELW